MDVRYLPGAHALAEHPGVHEGEVERVVPSADGAEAYYRSPDHPKA